jgi:Tol biopolymer transport system component
MWSPDGQTLAYVSRREGATEGGGAGTRNRYIIAMYSPQTGLVRDVSPALNMYPPVVRWSADGRSLLTNGRDLRGRQGLYRIDADTGAVAPIVLSGDNAELRSPSESPDGKSLYYMRGYVGDPDREFAVIERDLRSANEREVFRGRSIFAPTAAPLLSPDGQWVIVWTLAPATQASALLLVPVRGGQAKEIIRVDSPRRVTLQSWTPDGRAILVAIADAFQNADLSTPGAAAELWRVPLDGSDRRKLDVNVAGMTPFSVHPDGRQIAYGLTERAKDDEVWVLENFLPALGTKKP